MHIETIVKRELLPAGFNCYYEHWFPENPMALVVFVHGIGGYTAKFRGISTELIKKNYAVAMYDQRGFGRSAGRRGDAASARVWVKDLAEFVTFTKNSIKKDLPLILIAEGLGTPISVSYMVEKKGHAAAFIGLFSALEQKVELTSWQKRLPDKIVKMLPYLNVRFSENNDPLSVNAISLRAYRDMESLLHVIYPMAYRLQVPTLMFSHEEDAANRRATESEFFSRLQQPIKKMVVCQHGFDPFKDGATAVADEIDTWLHATEIIRGRR
ncbi:MAG: alpha/beta fold hydrolase [Pseudomonadota bacterium]